MFDTSAEFYDLIYSTFKNYKNETRQIANLLHRFNPRCQTVLDVACGTGEHARLLAAEGFTVDGLDLNPAFVRSAKQKHPDGRFFKADMSEFRVPYRYDAVLCLFSSIGYLQTLDRIARALNRFREHLLPAGVILVEPWFEPGALDPKRVSRIQAQGDGICVTRVSGVEIEDRISRLHFDYEIVDAAGCRRTSEIHELGLFSSAELLDAFRKAGLAADYDPKGLTDRGLYVARVAA